MKPDWDKLSEEFADSQKVVIADVDCTASGKALCEKYGVQGYPTIKTFSGPDDLEGEKYEGGRDLDSIRKHAESLGPPCNIDNKENCSPEDLPMLEKYAAMSTARRDAKVVKLTNSLKKAEADHEAVQKGLSAKFEASKAALEKLGAELKPQIKLLTAATPAKQ
jgi:hypothetical protein